MGRFSHGSVFLELVIAPFSILKGQPRPTTILRGPQNSKGKQMGLPTIFKTAHPYVWNPGIKICRSAPNRGAPVLRPQAKGGHCSKGGSEQGGLCATFSGKLLEFLVVKDSVLRGSPIFSEKVATRHPWVRKASIFNLWNTRVSHRLPVAMAIQHPSSCILVKVLLETWVFRPNIQARFGWWLLLTRKDL